MSNHCLHLIFLLVFSLFVSSSALVEYGNDDVTPGNPDQDLDDLLESEDLLRLTPAWKREARARRRAGAKSTRESLSPKATTPSDSMEIAQQKTSSPSKPSEESAQSQVQSSDDNSERKHAGSLGEDSVPLNQKPSVDSSKQHRHFRIDSEQLRIINNNFTLHSAILKNRLENLEEQIQKLKDNTVQLHRGDTSTLKARNHQQVVDFSNEVSTFYSDVNSIRNKHNDLTEAFNQFQSHFNLDNSENSEQESKGPMSSYDSPDLEVERIFSEVDHLKEQLLRLDTNIHRLRAVLHLHHASQSAPYEEDTSVDNFRIQTESLNLKLTDLDDAILRLKTKPQTIPKSMDEQGVPPNEVFPTRRQFQLQFPVSELHNKIADEFKSETGRLRKKVTLLKQKHKGMSTGAQIQSPVSTNNAFPFPADGLSHFNGDPSVQQENRAMENGVNDEDASRQLSDFSRLHREFLSEVGLLAQELRTLEDQIVSVKVQRHLLSLQDSEAGAQTQDAFQDMARGDTLGKIPDRQEDFIPQNDYVSNLSSWHDRTLHRVKRQNNGNRNGNNGNGIGNEASGGSETYPEQKRVPNRIHIQDKLTFPNSNNLSENEIQETVENSLNEAFTTLEGDNTVKVNSVTIHPVTGVVTVNWQATIEEPEDPDPNSFFGATNKQEFEDRLRDELNNTIAPVVNSITLGPYSPTEPMDVNSLVGAASQEMENPCANGCDPGYTNCVNGTDFGVAICTSKCQVYQTNTSCKHGSSCEIDENDNAFCACGKNWKGPYCETRKKSMPLSNGEIMGVVLGSILMFAGSVGCCCWFLLCRRSQKNMKYTDYSEDRGESDRFSQPSSKLTGFVIDRPHISTLPINLFEPSSHSSADTDTERSISSGRLSPPNPGRSNRGGRPNRGGRGRGRGNRFSDV